MSEIPNFGLQFFENSISAGRSIIFYISLQAISACKKTIIVILQVHKFSFSPNPQSNTPCAARYALGLLPRCAQSGGCLRHCSTLGAPSRSFYANGASIELIAKSLQMTEEEVREIVNAPVTVQA